MNKAQRTIFQVSSFMIAFAFLGSVIDYVGAAPDIEDLKIEINKRSEKIQELEAQIRETKNELDELERDINKIIHFKPKSITDFEGKIPEETLIELLRTITPLEVSR